MTNGNSRKSRNRENSNIIENGTSSVQISELSNNNETIKIELKLKEDYEKTKNIKIFGEEFVENNKNKCQMYIEEINDNNNSNIFHRNQLIDDSNVIINS